MQKTSTRSTDLFATCTHFCDTHALLPRDSTIIVGLSGGPDSVFLLNFLVSLRQQRNITLIAAHLDHGWRTDSHRDVVFCQKLAEQHQTLFVHGHARDFGSTDHTTRDGSLEALGRRARRTFFECLLKEYKAHAVAVGHHADDQLETFFIRLLRGAGVTGLAGIMPRSGHYIHPLLPLTKHDILKFLESKHTAFLTDDTNADQRFLRNRIRHTLIPTLEKTDMRFTKSARRTIELLQKTDSYVAHETEQQLKIVGLVRDEILWIDVKKLLALHPFLRDQVILAWLIRAEVPFTPSQHLVQEIVRFLGNSKNSTHTLYHSWRIIKKQWYACIEK